MVRLIFLFFVLPLAAFTQHQHTPHAGEIKQKLQKLKFLGSVLYVAAHPDDENTRIITAMANGRLATTAYLSMTRGDGGQNLIGPEIRDLLGLIRTQELLAARRIDGGQQFFTRANDFGYSKSADETFRIWGKDSILHDVIKVYREFRPDVIITRFPPDERAGHGHHTASAILAQEAFDLSADPKAFPAQLAKLGVWQPKRLLTNTGRWWNTSINESTPGIVSVDVGGFSPLIGLSYSEIAATSRSQHKSQGFGSRGTRGRQLEFLEPVKGEVKGVKDIFDGIDTSWKRVKGGEKILPLVDKLIAQFSEDKPAAIVPQLLVLRRQIRQLEGGIWKQRKLEETEDLIRHCLGLYLEVTADQYWVAPGEPVKLTVEVLNRSALDIKLLTMRVPAVSFDSTLNLQLNEQIPFLKPFRKTLRENLSYSAPYWLKEEHSTGRFQVSDFDLIGKPENDAAVAVEFVLSILGDEVPFREPVVYKWTDPVKGELSRPFEIVPPVFMSMTEDVRIFGNNQPQTVKVQIKSASRKPLVGKILPRIPDGWKADPAEIPFTLSTTGEEQIKTFRIFPSETPMVGELQLEAIIEGKRYDRSIRVISYDHIPIQTLMPAAKAKVVRVDILDTSSRIAYLKGAGDDIPAALRSMGFDVWEMRNEEVNPENLKRVDAVVLGVRALNTNERIGFLMTDLLEFVKAGGTLVVQYNTNFDLETDKFSPFPLNLSRDRVTEEDAEVRILKPDHPVLNSPNKITAADFENWVQERGLYFPGKWAPEFEAILSMNDNQDTAKDGALLVARYGKGHYVYTGLSFFRELPEGVPGAYKLFANLVSLKPEPSALPKPEPASEGRRRKPKN